MKKTFAFHAAVVVAALAMVNVACSRKKSEDSPRVGAVGPADKAAPTTAETLNSVFKNMEATFDANRDSSLAQLIGGVAVGKSLSDTSGNGAIGAPIASFKASIFFAKSPVEMTFSSDAAGITAMKSGQIITLVSGDGYNQNLLGDLTVQARCLDACDRIALLVKSFEKKGYKMDSLPRSAGMIFKSEPGKGYVLEHALEPTKDLATYKLEVGDSPSEKLALKRQHDKEVETAYSMQTGIPL